MTQSEKNILEELDQYLDGMQDIPVEVVQRLARTQIFDILQDVPDKQYVENYLDKHLSTIADRIALLQKHQGEDIDRYQDMQIYISRLQDALNNATQKEYARYLKEHKNTLLYFSKDAYAQLVDTIKDILLDGNKAPGYTVDKIDSDIRRYLRKKVMHVDQEYSKHIWGDLTIGQKMIAQYMMGMIFDGKDYAQVFAAQKTIITDNPGLVITPAQINVLTKDFREGNICKKKKISPHAHLTLDQKQQLDNLCKELEVHDDIKKAIVQLTSGKDIVIKKIKELEPNNNSDGVAPYILATVFSADVIDVLREFDILNGEINGYISVTLHTAEDILDYLSHIVEAEREEAKKKKEEEEAKKKKAEEEAEKKKAEEEAEKKKEEEEAKKKKEEEEAKKKKAEEEAKKKKAEEEAKKKKAEEEAEKKKQKEYTVDDIYQIKCDFLQDCHVAGESDTRKKAKIAVRKIRVKYQQYHPDKNTGHEELMKFINSELEFLLKTFEVGQPDYNLVRRQKIITDRYTAEKKKEADAHDFARAEKKRKAEEAEEKRKAEEAEEKRKAEEAEEKRRAEEAEKKRKAAEEAAEKERKQQEHIHERKQLFTKTYKAYISSREYNYLLLDTYDTISTSWKTGAPTQDLILDMLGGKDVIVGGVGKLGKKTREILSQELTTTYLRRIRQDYDKKNFFASDAAIPVAAIHTYIAASMSSLLKKRLAEIIRDQDVDIVGTDVRKILVKSGNYKREQLLQKIEELRAESKETRDYMKRKAPRYSTAIAYVFDHTNYTTQRNALKKTDEDITKHKKLAGIDAHQLFTEIVDHKNKVSTKKGVLKDNGFKKMHIQIGNGGAVSCTFQVTGKETCMLHHGVVNKPGGSIVSFVDDLPAYLTEEQISLIYYHVLREKIRFIQEKYGIISSEYHGKYIRLKIDGEAIEVWGAGKPRRLEEAYCVSDSQDALRRILYFNHLYDVLIEEKADAYLPAKKKQAGMFQGIQGKEPYETDVFDDDGKKLQGYIDIPHPSQETLNCMKIYDISERESIYLINGVYVHTQKTEHEGQKQFKKIKTYKHIEDIVASVDAFFYADITKRVLDRFLKDEHKKHPHIMVPYQDGYVICYRDARDGTLRMTQVKSPLPEELDTFLVRHVTQVENSQGRVYEFNDTRRLGKIADISPFRKKKSYRNESRSTEDVFVEQAPFTDLDKVFRHTPEITNNLVGTIANYYSHKTK